MPFSSELRKYFVLFCLAILNTPDLFAQIQTNFLDRAVQKLNQSSVEFPDEKTYLHFDKSYYLAGEDIWFKGYVTAGERHKLTNLSKVLTIEVAAPSGYIIKTMKLPLQNGTCQGNISLPDTLRSGTYIIRAYTNWMRNFESDYYFTQRLNIGSPVLDAGNIAKPDVRQKPDKSVPTGISLQFFPESGYMVDGFPANVAFKAIGSDGLGKKVTGIIVDDNNNEVAQFETVHLGMGQFSLRPLPGVTYKAKFKTETGRDYIVALPAALKKGFTMRLFNDTTQVVISIFGNGAIDTSKSFHLVAQSHGLVCYAADLKIKGSKPVLIRIPNNKFPSGITQVTLFSESGEPINERVIFVDNKADNLNLKISTDKNIYSSRQQANVDVVATDNENHYAEGNFSAAVVNETLTGDLIGNSILTSLLLTSDIKGNIEDPCYYFDNTNDRTRSDLDLLMLTQGYRRYRWENNDQPIEKPKFAPEQGLIISGSVKTLSGSPVANAKVRLFTTNGAPVLIDTLTNSAGHFAFTDLDFRDSTKFVIQASTLKGSKNVVVSTDTSSAYVPVQNHVSNNKQIPENYIIAAKRQYDQTAAVGFGKTRLLEEVKVSEKRNPALKHSSNLNGPGRANYILDGKKIRDMACPTLVSCLIGRLPGVIFDAAGNPRSPRNIESAKDPRPGVMLVIIDGIKQDAGIAGDDNHLGAGPFLNLNPTDVASIELLTDPSLAIIYGPQARNGVIIVNTLRGDELSASLKHDTNALPIKPVGFHVSKEFYSPDYSVNNDLSKPDLRTTIAWKPLIITNKDGKANFSFYNADTKGTYRIILEGIDKNGNIGHQVYRYKVE